MRRVQMRQGKAVFGALLAIGLFLAASVIVLSAFSPKANFDLTRSSMAQLQSFGSSSVEFSDNFTADSKLNTSAWEINGPPADTSMAEWGPAPMSAVRPTLGFSPVQGLNLSGATENFTYENVQALPSFEPPFYAQTKVEATASHGGPVAFAIATANGGQGINIVGNLNTSNRYYGVGSTISGGSGQTWIDGVVLDPNPSLDTWYTLSIGLNSTGMATVTVAHGSTVLGSSSTEIGTGTYYLWLGQFVNVPPVNGPNSASWSYVDVNFTPPVPPAPKLVRAIADPDSIQLGANTTLDVFVVGGATPLSVAYYALPPGCTSRSTLALLCVPTEAGNYTVLVNVTDSLARSATGEVNLSVAAPPSPPVAGPPQVNLVLSDPSSIPLGETTDFYVVVSGGTLPLSVTYTGLPLGCTSYSSMSLACTPTQTGSFSVFVAVTDAQGRTSQGETALTVTAVPTTTSVAAGSAYADGALALGGIAVVLAVAALFLSRRRGGPGSTGQNLG